MRDTQYTRVRTPEAMLSYQHLDKPQASREEGKEPKYSATLVFAPGTDLSELRAAAFAAAEAKWGAKAAEMFKKKQLRAPFRDDAEAKGYPAGSIFLNCRSGQAPGCVYPHAAPGSDKPAKIEVEDIREVLYPGAIVRATLRAFAYDTNGNKGVSFALNNVQKLREGNRLDNRVAAEDDFEVDLTAAPADLSDLI